MQPSHLPPRDASAPVLSVVLVTQRSLAPLAATLAHLRAQAEAPRMELLIAVLEPASFTLDDDRLAGFGSVAIVPAVGLPSATARALAVARARADIVVFGEDHAFPQPGWATALLAAHRGPWAAVGPVALPALANSTVARASQLIGYSAFLMPSADGTVADLPGRNSSYKRALLLEYGAGLVELLDVEYLLHQDLRRRGHQLFLASAAHIQHYDVGEPLAFLQEQFLIGRALAARRARRWSLWRRLAYVLGTPLIPLVRLQRIARHLRQRRLTVPVRVVAWLLIGLAAATIGELAGHTLGDGGAGAELTNIELHNRARHAGPMALDRQPAAP